MKLFYLLKVYLLPSSIKKTILKRHGTIGKNFSIGIGSWVDCKKITIGDNVTIGNGTLIITQELEIKNNVTIGSKNRIEAHKYIKIGDNCKISEQNIFGGTQLIDSSIEIGKNVHIYPFCYINTTMPVVFEDGVGIGGGTYIFTHGSWQDAYEGFPYSYEKVTIKKNAWLPWRVFVMPGVTIGEDATIGSNALISKDIPDRSFAVGMPAKVVKKGNEYIKIMDNDNKITLLENILTMFKNQTIELENIQSKIIKSVESIELQFSNNHNITYSTNSQIPYGNNTFISEFENIPNSENCIIDMKSKKYINASHPIDKLLIKFLTNFGIRLEEINN